MIMIITPFLTFLQQQPTINGHAHPVTKSPQWPHGPNPGGLAPEVAAKPGAAQHAACPAEPRSGRTLTF